MNIVLIGYRGTGKTFVSRVLSKRLGMPIVSIDQEIIKKAKMTIPELVKKKGWDYFRQIESEITRQVSSYDNHIIDCGGGIILKQENIDSLKASGKVFWLKAGVETIISRIEHGDDRPSLTGRSFTEEVKDVLKERMPKYKKAADYEIDTDGLSVEETAEEILNILGEKHAP